MQSLAFERKHQEKFSLQDLVPGLRIGTVIWSPGFDGDDLWSDRKAATLLQLVVKCGGRLAGRDCNALLKSLVLHSKYTATTPEV